MRKKKNGQPGLPSQLWHYPLPICLFVYGTSN